MQRNMNLTTKVIKPLDDANEMKAILDAIVSGDDDLIKELTTGNGKVDEVSDDFVIE